MSATVLAFDFGASSGRAIRAQYENGSLRYEEVHRFENTPRRKDGALRWNFADLMKNVRIGIEKAGKFDSIGFDTWGIDFGLIDSDGKLLADPVHYRDERTRGSAEEFCRKMPAAQLYAETGNQIMDMNTLFQLLKTELKGGEHLLFMPDLFVQQLCGQRICEQTVASTSQMLNPTSLNWSHSVLETAGISTRLFSPIVESGTVVGSYKGAKVIAVAGHDTQCAVAAMPSQDENAAFLSCGTWSLLGCELDSPILTERSKRAALSNELGANGKVNYLKNIIGLWLIQESRREWRRQGQEYSYADLEKQALAAQPLRCFIDPDDPIFTPPGDIPGRVQEYCRKTGQYVPETVGEVMRCIYESLALKYRFAVDQLEQMTGKTFSTLHILGGGTKDGLLCRMTAESIDRRVVAGPVEATALGNILIQLVALRELPSIEAGRKLIARTEKLTEYMPKDPSPWKKVYPFYKTLLQSTKNCEKERSL